jgi:hypothetical protein
MKKFLAILMVICIMGGLLCVPAFAAEPAPGTVMSVSAIKYNGSAKVLGNYDNFQTGWNEAMWLAGRELAMAELEYDRIIVTLYADWNAADDGNFTDDSWNDTNGAGFNNDTIYIPEYAALTLDLNNHTIDRGLTAAESDGEVIYIAPYADVIIKNGTITGGCSNNGAGGIHIKGDARVTLNNVNIVNNYSKHDGGGISVAGDTILTMNGGSFENNTIVGVVETSHYQPNCYGGAVYVDGATAIFKGVEFKGNNAPPLLYNYGAAIYADDSEVTIEECVFDGNGLKNEADDIDFSTSIVQAEDSIIKVKGSTFTNNGGLITEIGGDYSSTFKVDDSELTIEASEFSNNSSHFVIIDKDESTIHISETKFLNNKSAVMCGNEDTTSDSFFNNCTFENNVSSDFATFYNITTIMTFYNCSMGNSTFNVKDRIKFVNDALTANAVLRVSALKKDGTTVVIDEYKILDDGWNAAMELADDYDEMSAKGYDRIVVDLYADWNAIDSEFTDDFVNGSGFNWDAIYFQDGVKMTLNMNGHTINRGLTQGHRNGEVIYIDEDADVIINDGTITGGGSGNGAAGIHIMDGAKVTLNNVKVDGNTCFGSDGAGIAVYDGAILVMNGGSISNNLIVAKTTADWGLGCNSGTLYVCNATVKLDNVTLDSNTTDRSVVEGVAIYATDSTVTMNNCVVSNNAAPEKNIANSVIAAYDSKFVITNTEFIGNAAVDDRFGDSYLFELDDSTLTLEGGKITGSKANELFHITDSRADIKSVTITDNASVVIYVDNDGEKVTMTKCTLSNNTPVDNAADIHVETESTMAMIDCTFGNDTTFADKSMVAFSDKAVGSIFGEGSLTMIVAILALITSVVCIFLIVDMKKKLVPATAKHTSENEDEE